ncbi:DUF3325 domain-containing protein [Bordetella holmesii]|uniref:PF11804 family protein n=2 Tax=Bordetella holmesii TaxID=35814 RepID=A0A158M3I0_9BORD|nr:DUF3325 domain-containing protein [Bordetella holmesii]AHV91240.1 hypothetical protein D560_2427 [Bordetella holmesii ATCC 51541]AIT27070.1 hypothetical protein D558_2409 [Bordetella holmesii 44057]EWM43044.1 hypothetical protein D556_2410 [Bordetella holmesii 41130]EWM47650.1 hypothetical protein D555_2441 [Bordetella holmesii 35009]EWM51820.1 hypothetical protein D557_1682 [Bordetella holmesii 70147]
MNAAAFCLAYARFTALSMAMDRHFEDAFDRTLPAGLRRALRAGGSLALALSLWLCARLHGWSYGSVLWIGMLSISGLLLIWVMTYRPRAAWTAGIACLAIAPLFAALAGLAR